MQCCLYFRDNLLELRVYYESLTYSDVKQVPSYDLYSLLGKGNYGHIRFVRTGRPDRSVCEQNAPFEDLFL